MSLPVLVWWLPSLSFQNLPIRKRRRSPLSRFPLCFARPSPDSRCVALLRLPLSRCAALLPLPHCSALSSTATTVPFQIERETAESSRPTTEPMRRRRNRAGQHQNPRGDRGSRGRKHVHKAIRCRLTPEASQERPDT